MSKFDAAQSIYTSKKYKDAIPLLQAAIAEDPNNAVAHFQLGNCLRNVNKLQECVVEYNEAIILDNKYVTAYKNLSLVMDILKDTDGAISVMMRALDHVPGDIEFYLSLLTLLMDKKKDAASALRIISRALELFPSDDRLDKLFKMVSQDPTLDTEAVSIVLLDLVDKGDKGIVDKLVKNEAKVHQVFSNDDLIARKCGIAKQSLKTSALVVPETVPIATDEGMLTSMFSMFTSHNVSKAAHLGYVVCDVKNSARPDTFGLTTLERTALWLFSLKNSSITLSQGLYSADPAPFLPYLKLLSNAISKLPVHCHVVACSAPLDLHADYKPDSEIFWWGITSVTRFLDNCTEGNEGAPRTVFIIETQGAVDVSPYWRYGSDEELLLPANSKLRVVSSRQMGEGLFIVRLVHLYEPPAVDGKAKYAAAVAAYTAKKFNDAIALFEEFLTTDRTNPQAFFQLANAYRSEKKFPQAVDNYKQVLELNPTFTTAYGNLAGTYSFMKKNADVIQILEEGIKAVPKELPLHLQLYGVYAVKKDTANMQRVKANALKEFPDDPELLKLK